MDCMDGSDEWKCSEKTGSANLVPYSTMYWFKFFGIVEIITIISLFWNNQMPQNL